jgi:hypothetical protein
MRHFFVSIVFLLTITSCVFSDKSSNPLDLDFDYAYEIMTYHGDTLDNKNLRHVEYFDSNGKLLRVVGTEEGCTRFIYNDQGQLIEKIWGRTCDKGLRELMIYDSSKNLIGTYRTRDSLINIDTATYKQLYFYDNDNNLIKQFEREWNNLEGEHFERWNFYTYENGRRIKDTIRQNQGLVWAGTYEYDLKSNLISLSRVRRNILEIRTFKYDSLGILIEEEIRSNEYPLTPEVTFSASNNKTYYKYSQDGQLIEKKNMNHKGKVNSRVLYKKRWKN